MAETEADPAALLSAVIATQAEEQQAELLANYLATHPTLVLVFLQPLISQLSNASATAKLKLWILDSALRQALAMPALPVDQKTQRKPICSDYIGTVS